jgi:2'-5' RNA ligase
MNHLVIPLDVGHASAFGELVEGVATAACLGSPRAWSKPHVTLIAHDGLPRAAAGAAIEGALAATAPFTLRAQGYGFFTGSDALDLSLHVPVVRDRPLDALHRDLCAALRQAGADIAGWSEPQLWTPHITLVDRELDAARLGQAVAWLAGRHHPSWRIPVDRVVLSGGWPERDGADTVLLFGSRVEAGVDQRRGQVT